MSGLTRDRTAEPNSREDKNIRREQGQGKFRFPCSAEYEQDWQPYPVDTQSAESHDHTRAGKISLRSFFQFPISPQDIPETIHLAATSRIGSQTAER